MRGQPVHATRSTSERRMVHESVRISVNSWRAIHFGPERWQRAVNARQACEQRVVTEWSTHRPRVKGLRLRRSGDATELI
jgi:hypothetical protein